MEKEYEFWIVLNHKNGRVRTTSRKPKRTSPWELVIKTNIKVDAPKDQEFQAKGSITIPPAKLNEMFIEAIEDKDE